MLVFGESENDTKLIRELLIALCPDLHGMVETFRKPLVLVRDCPIDQLPGQLDRICGVIDAESVAGEVICVFAHQDCDAVEPAHIELSEKIESGFASKGYQVHAVTPAWETESWLFLWPAVLASYCPSWNKIDKYIGKQVGRIPNAKEELRRSLRPGRKNAKNREYRETDAPAIASKVRELGLANQPQAVSESYNRFREQVDACCTHSAPRRSRSHSRAPRS